MMRGERGSTLVVLMIVVLILGALAAIAIPRATFASKAAGINACKTNVVLINSQIELYHHKTGSWPNNIKDVTENIDYFPDGPPECPFGQKYKMRKDQNKYRVIEHSH